MTKSKKITMGSLAAISVIAIPVIAVVSCGAKGVSTYDTENDGKIIIQTGWSANGNQKKALVEAVNEYNTQQKSVKGFMPVSVVSIEGGYGKMASTLSTKIQTKKTKGMPNLLIEYADSLGIINKYKFALDMNKTTPAFDKGLISNDFMKVNSQIGGADASGTYMAPLGKSTEMVGVNKPLLYMTLHDAGYTVAGKNPILDAIFKDDTNNKKDADEQHKSENWGSLKSNSSQAILDAADDSIFDSWESLMKFSDAVAKGYSLKPDGEKFIVAHDSGTNLVYSLGYLKGGNNMDNFLFTKQKGGKGYIDYKLFDKGSKQNKIFKEILGELKSHVDAGSLKIAGGGEYTSSLMTQHKVMFSIGSSAGYSHLSSKGGAFNLLEEAKLKTGKTASIKQFKPLKIFMDGTTIKGQGSNSKYKNKIVATKSAKSHDIEVGAEALKGIQEYLKNNNNKEFVLLKDPTTGDSAEKAGFKDYKKIKGGYGILPIGKDTIIPGSTSLTQSLQENELEVFSGIKKLKKSSTKTMAFSQGPSFVAVHANKEEDNATVMFLNWFYNQKNKTKTTWTGRHKVNVKTGTPIAIAFDKMSGYITPIAGFETKLDKVFNGTQQTIHTKGAQVAFKSYRDEVNSPNGNVFFTPVDDYSSSMRQTLSATIKSIFTNAHTSGKSESVDDIYKNIRIAAKTNKII